MKIIKCAIDNLPSFEILLANELERLSDPPPSKWSILQYVLTLTGGLPCPRSVTSWKKIVAKLRQVSVMVSQGTSVADAARTTEVTYYRLRSEFGGLKSDQAPLEAESTVKGYHYDTHDQLRTHLQLFVNPYNHARRLKTMRGLKPYEYVCHLWTKEPERFRLNPSHHISGTYTQITKLT